MRLIDADKFMEVLLKLKDINERCPLEKEQLEDNEVNNYDLGQKETFELVMEHLEKQPTAYDMDKVVEQLKEKSEDDTCGGVGCIWVEDAVNIVKAGLKH